MIDTKIGTKPKSQIQNQVSYSIESLNCCFHSLYETKMIPNDQSDKENHDEFDENWDTMLSVPIRQISAENHSLDDHRRPKLVSKRSQSWGDADCTSSRPAMIRNIIGAMNPNWEWSLQFRTEAIRPARVLIWISAAWWRRQMKI